MAPGFPSNRGARDSLLAMDFDRDGSATRNPPLHGRHPRSGPDGDAPPPASLVHGSDRTALRPHGLRMELRPISAADGRARTGSDSVHDRLGGRCATRVSHTQVRPQTAAVDPALTGHRLGAYPRFVGGWRSRETVLDVKGRLLAMRRSEARALAIPWATDTRWKRRVRSGLPLTNGHGGRVFDRFRSAALLGKAD